VKTKLLTSLVYLNILTWILYLVIYFNFGDLSQNYIPTIILGIPFLLFSPGYALVASWFPGSHDLSISKRLAFSFGLSLIITPMLGLALNYTAWGIRLIPVITSITAFIFAASIAAWIRLRRLPESERASIGFSINMPVTGRGKWDMILTATLIILILGVGSIFTYFFSKPLLGETYTQFYITPVGTNVEAFPKELQMGEIMTVNIAIGNHEGVDATYRIKVLFDGIDTRDLGPVTLASGETWDDYLFLLPQHTGDNQKVEFLLYKNTDSQLYLDPLYIWLNVN
jgi:uncharacterized membrane protein